MGFDTMSAELFLSGSGDKNIGSRNYNIESSGYNSISPFHIIEHNRNSVTDLNRVNHMKKNDAEIKKLQAVKKMLIYSSCHQVINFF